MWTAILSWFVGGGFSGIAADLEQAYKDKLAADNDAARLAANERIQSLQAQKDVLVAEAANRWNGLLRFVAALGPIIYVNKIFFDKICACGSTDNLSPDGWYLVMLIYGFLFVHWTVGAWKS